MVNVTIKKSERDDKKVIRKTDFTGLVVESKWNLDGVSKRG